MEKYPVSLSIDYSDKSNRVTVLFRLFLAIPILIILDLLTSSSYENEQAANAYALLLTTDEFPPFRLSE